MTKEEKPIAHSLIGKDLVPLNKVDEVVSEQFGVSGMEIFTRCREVEYIRRRYLFFLLASQFNPNQSLRQLGKYCENVYGIKKYDHATVLNAKREAENLMKTDKKLRSSYEVMRNVLNREAVKNLKDSEGQDEFLLKKKELIDDVLCCQTEAELMNYLEQTLSKNKELLSAS